MIACILSNLELRGMIESALKPWQCNCSIMDGTMTVEVIDPITGRAQVLARGIQLDRLDTSRAICELIHELRMDADLRHRQPNQGHALAS